MRVLEALDGIGRIAPRKIETNLILRLPAEVEAADQRQ
jgi:hypothetical protein